MAFGRNLTILGLSRTRPLRKPRRRWLQRGSRMKFCPFRSTSLWSNSATKRFCSTPARAVSFNLQPDHVFGLMSRAPDNTPTFPNAVVYVPSNEYKFWMDESIFTKLPEKQHGLPKRLQAMFPLLKDKLKQYEWDTEIIPGIRSIAAPGHTPGHTAFHVASGNEQLVVLSDTTNMPALFAKHPNWHGAVDADPVLAEATRRRLFDRAVSDKALVTGYHFPFPAVGKIVVDGAGYTFVPAA